jgi:beta-galactosidase
MRVEFRGWRAAALVGAICWSLGWLQSTACAGDVARSRTPLVQWQFVEDTAADSGAMSPPASTDWQTVNVPHVFRQSGVGDESAGWYRQILHVSPTDRGSRFYLMLEGAASVKDVFVNGQHIGQHKGAFSRASFDLTEALKFDQDNTLDVRVSNRKAESEGCFSRSTLYFINGGMFRPAWLIKTAAVHIFPDMGSSGVYLTPKNITPAIADLDARAVIRNTLTTPVTASVRYFVTAPDGKACGEMAGKAAIPAGQTATVEAVSAIANPRLWDLARPNLYSVRAQVSVDGKVTDELTERCGFRTIAWKDQRFYLNGREVQFRGVCKHSQDEDDWNAVGDDQTRWEWKWIADLGANAVRLAHYPHRALEYDLGDEMGIAIWAEDGYAGQNWKGPGNEDKTVTPDGDRLVREMVRQNWNHPSILFWSAGNETVVNVVSHYASVIHQEDTTRLVTYAASGPVPKNCDFVAQNTYDGWYSGHYSQFSELPRNALISETGGGDWVTHHVPYGALQWSVDKFEPEEYAGIFAEYRMQTICRNAVAEHPMFFWWNFREFYNLKFKNNRNTKGLLTLAGAPKDLYYLFKSFFNPTPPVVHLCDREFFLRSFAPDNGIKAYSNSARLRLTLNGTAGETLSNGSYRLPDSDITHKDGTKTPDPGITVANVFLWKTPLQPGKNVIEVTDEQGRSDRMVIYQKLADGIRPADPGALVQGLHGSNPDNTACFIDRPVEAQGAFYIDVNGSSDNTFDRLPAQVQGASWIATRRLSDPKLQTDLTFAINSASKGASVFVIFSTGKYPIITLRKPDPSIAVAAAAMRTALTGAGFKALDGEPIWRDHDLNLADAELWRREYGPGESVTIPGRTLDYVVMLRPAETAIAK